MRQRIIMPNTPKRPDVEGIEARAENLRICENCGCTLADLVAIAKPTDTEILITHIEVLEARQVKLEAVVGAARAVDRMEDLSASRLRDVLAALGDGDGR